MNDTVPAPGRAKKLLLLGVTGCVVLGLLGTGLWVLLNKKSTHQGKPPKISLLTPAAPPPPPPPPPKFEKKPDPPKEQKEMKVDQQVERKVEPAPSPELKMDGPAGDGPSGFAAGKITSDDISKLGTGKGGVEKAGGLFNPYTGYANLLKSDLQRYLAKQGKLRQRRYAIEVLVWITPAGALKRFELIGSTSDSDTDDAIQAAIEGMPVFSQVPPANMPQPIRLRIITNS